MRAVLDANIFVSAIINPHGMPARILNVWRMQEFYIVMSQATLAEIGKVLRYPKIAKYHRWSEERLQLFLDDLEYVAVMVPGELSLSVISNDPSDDRYLECAVEGEAAYIVSGDNHLLKLDSYAGILIVTPRIFLEVLETHTALYS